MNKIVLLCACLASLCFSTAHAAIVDLTAPHSLATVSTSYGTAIFTTDFASGTGSGTFNPFLSIQANGTEQGYNTSASGGVFDTKRNGTYTRGIQVKDLATVMVNGADYYSFVIDVNEPGSGESQISLDALKIFTSSTGGQNTTNVESLGTKRFDLGSTILYNDALSSGSGNGDIAFFIPVTAFIGASPNDYVYVYQAWGGYSAPGFSGASQSGFEETAIGIGVVPVPEFSSILPLGLVLGSVVGVRQFRRRRGQDLE
ncbi:hypothetical protein ACXR0O_16050 [Verrucomicrobiota bacterium sgz303538]